ncbi:hypothetical protein MRX96_012310 [Rhipicephalus microplus]
MLPDGEHRKVQIWWQTIRNPKNRLWCAEKLLKGVPEHTPESSVTVVGRPSDEADDSWPTTVKSSTCRYMTGERRSAAAVPWPEVSMQPARF